MERLDKLISSAFGISRKDAREAVKRGRVTANGEAVREPERRVAEDARLCLDGAEAGYEKYVYIMMDKPEGYVSATEDSRDTPVTELLPPELLRRGLGVAGRLDKDATGLLLLTDDGELNHRLTSPAYHLDKIYEVRLDLPADASDAEAFREGIELSDFRAMPAMLEICESDTLCCRVILKEGKFHQVKRMFEARGKRVLSLRRTAMGGLVLDSALGSGGFRRLTVDEWKYLAEKCGLKRP